MIIQLPVTFACSLPVSAWTKVDSITAIRRERLSTTFSTIILSPALTGRKNLVENSAVE
nr:hypothetical protein [Parasphingopyxis sp.]